MFARFTFSCSCVPPEFSVGVTFQDPTAEIVQMNKMFYPKPWLEAVGFFTSIEVTGSRFTFYRCNAFSDRAHSIDVTNVGH